MKCQTEVSNDIIISHEDGDGIEYSKFRLHHIVHLTASASRQKE